MRISSILSEVMALSLLARADRAVARHHGLSQTLRIVFEHEVIVHHAGFRGLHLALHTDVGHSDIQTGQTLSGRRLITYLPVSSV